MHSAFSRIAILVLELTPQDNSLLNILLRIAVLRFTRFTLLLCCYYVAITLLCALAMRGNFRPYHVHTRCGVSPFSTCICSRSHLTLRCSLQTVSTLADFTWLNDRTVYLGQIDTKMSTNFELAKLSAVDTARLLGTNSKEKRDSRKRGPSKTTVKVKFYLLPDVSEIPTFNPKKELDAKVSEHMSHGYGKFSLVLNSNCCFL